MKIIKLSKASNYTHTFVSDCDYESLSMYPWHLSENGYAYRYFYNKGKKKKVYMHRYILQPPTGKEVDHINRNKLDNRRSNIRLVKRSQNAHNLSKSKKNTSGYSGVYFDKSLNKWRAKININYKQVMLGCYNNPKDASDAYIKKSKEVSLL